jgi:serine/threonine protein kinase
LSQPTCPTELQLQRYSNGVSSDAEAHTIVTHLDECATCLDKLNSLSTQPDPFVAALQSPARPNSGCHPALLRALEDAVSIVPTFENAPAPKPGTALANYQILDEIGRGGMGRVYRARHPRLGQEVALKVLRPGMDSSALVARFEAERHTLARMDHPHIARIFDGGVTEDGRPFFVMELVRGVSITAYAVQHQLPLRARLELFCHVCQAVQHAHQKGIIHRDLKPSNVLVAEYDGKPAPKIIDFGVAKALERRVTLQTEVGTLVGTPEYMSPEQTNLSEIDIDTRSDVYALGVILFELLTGDTPFGRSRVRETPLLEVLRIIREEAPVPPSQCCPRLPHTQGIAAKELRGDLDWIVLKCLEKDRSRRYDTAAALADDVRRYLNDEPVLAGPPSRAYQLRRFLWRNRVPVVAAASVFLVLVAGVTVSTALAIWAIRSEKEAKDDRDKALAAGERADEAAAIAKAVNEFFQNDVIRIADTDQQALQRQSVTPNITVKQAVDRAAERIGDRFQNQPLVEAAIRNAIGEAYGGLGEPRLAVPHFERSLALWKTHRSPDDPDVILTMRYLAKAYYEAGQLADALRLRREVLRLQRSRAANDADLLISMDILAEAYHGGTNLADALKLHEEVLPLQKAAWGPDHADTLDSMWGLASGYNQANRIDDAVLLCEELLPRMRKTLGSDHANTLSCMGGLAGLYGRQGRHSLAISLRLQSLELFRSSRGWDHPDTLSDMVGLAQSYIEAGQFVEGISLHEETLKLRRMKLGGDHPRTVQSMTLLAAAWEKMDEHVKAEPLLREVVRSNRQQFGADHYKSAGCLVQLGRNLLRQQRYVDAEPILREALTINETLGGDDWETSQARCLLGEALLGQQKYLEAETQLLKGHDGLTRHQEKIPGVQRQRVLTEAPARLAQLYQAWNKPDLALQWKRRLHDVQGKRWSE